MKVAILGATRGIGRALARQMAARGDRLAVLGRDPEALEATARDLEVRGGSEAGSVAAASCDLAKPETFTPALDAAADALGGLDCVIVTAGVFAPQEALERDRRAAIELMTLDFAHTVAFCETAREALLAAGGGTLCAFGSVAGDRGRPPVAIYGAAKAGLASYLEATDHAYRRQGLRTVCVKPGFVRTGMTAGLPEPPFAAEPEAAARAALRAIDRGTPVAYAPGVWRWIMRAVRALPRAAMRRLRF